jgi:hypothetical protein
VAERITSFICLLKSEPLQEIVVRQLLGADPGDRNILIATRAFTRHADYLDEVPTLVSASGSPSIITQQTLQGISVVQPTIKP